MRSLFAIFLTVLLSQSLCIVSVHAGPGARLASSFFRVMRQYPKAELSGRSVFPTIEGWNGFSGASRGLGDQVKDPLHRILARLNQRQAQLFCDYTNLRIALSRQDATQRGFSEVFAVPDDATRVAFEEFADARLPSIQARRINIYGDHVGLYLNAEVTTLLNKQVVSLGGGRLVPLEDGLRFLQKLEVLEAIHAERSLLYQWHTLAWFDQISVEGIRGMSSGYSIPYVPPYVPIRGRKTLTIEGGRSIELDMEIPRNRFEVNSPGETMILTFDGAVHPSTGIVPATRIQELFNSSVREARLFLQRGERLDVSIRPQEVGDEFVVEIGTSDADFLLLEVLDRKVRAARGALSH